MLRLKSIRPIDAVIAVLITLVLIIGITVGVSVWMQRQKVIKATPVSRAVDDLVAKVRKKPNDIAARMNLAQALAMANRDKEAVEQYEAILTIEKDHPAALAGLGFIALRRGEWDVGEQYYRRIIELREGQVDETKDTVLGKAYFYLGTALMEQGDYEEAAQNLKNSLAIRRDASDAHYLLAVCFRELDNPRKYKASLENAMLFDPKMPEANYDYANILLEEGDIAGASEHLRISADAAPTDNRPAEAMAKLGSGAGHFAKAKTLVDTDLKQALIQARMAAALQPTIEYRLLLASLYEKDRNPDFARAVYSLVLDDEPMNEEAKAGLERVGR